MRRMHRIVLLAGLVAIAPVLAGCEDFDIDKFDVFGLNEKKKLPGDRKELFPEGVPGVTQGIPPEYLKEQPAAARDRASAGSGAACYRRARAGGQDRGTRPRGRAEAEAETQAQAETEDRGSRPAHAKSPCSQPAQSQDQQQPLPPWPGSSPQQAPQQQSAAAARHLLALKSLSG